jgi:hypothetical protein
MDLDLETYFNTAHLSFQQQVCKRNERFERTIRVGEKTAVRLQFANERLLSYFLPAVEHILIDNSEQNDLTICVWDSTDGSGKPPCPSWQTQRNYQWVDLLASEHVKVACELSPARMTAIDFQKKLALFWINDATQFPWFEQSRPFRTILHWWGAAQNLHLLHAAAVGTADDGGVLLVGKGGAGKSTTALTCLNAGMLYASDDHCLVGFEDSAPVAYGLYNAAKLNMMDSISRFPELDRCIVNRDKLHVEKAMMFLFPHYPERMAKKLPLKAVLVPVVTGRPDTSVVKTNWQEAAAALIPSTMTELQGSEVNDFYGMLRIVRSLPCYRLELGIEIEQIPKVISEVLSSLPTQQHKSTVLATASAPGFQPEPTSHYQLDLADLTAK